MCIFESRPYSRPTQSGLNLPTKKIVKSGGFSAVPFVKKIYKETIVYKENCKREQTVHRSEAIDKEEQSKFYKPYFERYKMNKKC